MSIFITSGSPMPEIFCMEVEPLRTDVIDSSQGGWKDYDPFDDDLSTQLMCVAEIAERKWLEKRLEDVGRNHELDEPELMNEDDNNDNQFMDQNAEINGGQEMDESNPSQWEDIEENLLLTAADDAEVTYKMQKAAQRYTVPIPLPWYSEVLSPSPVPFSLPLALLIPRG